MGSILEPADNMKPWWGVEARSESFFLTAVGYVEASNRIRLGKGTSSEEERAAAWYADGDMLTAPGPPAALRAALDQVLQHPSYQRWREGHAPSGEAHAERYYDRISLLVPGALLYRTNADDGYVSEVEIEYKYAAVLREAVMTVSVEDSLVGKDEVLLFAARKRIESASNTVCRFAHEADLTALGTEELPAAVSALDVAETLDEEEDAARWVSRTFTATPMTALKSASGESSIALCGAVLDLRMALGKLDDAKRSTCLP